MKENTLELSFKMYEELKETLIKTLRSELAEARSQPAAPVDTDAIKHLQIRILQLEQTQTRVSEAQQERGHRIEQRLHAISDRLLVLTGRNPQLQALHVDVYRDRCAVSRTLPEEVA